MISAPISFDDLPRAAGLVVVGEPFVLTDEGSRDFHRATWLDRAYEDEAEEFPDGIVEGFWLLSMVDAISRLTGVLDSRTLWGLNYGVEKVRFVSPVYLGQAIVPEFEILEIQPRGAGYKVLQRCTFRVEGDERPAMVADWWGFVQPRRGTAST